MISCNIFLILLSLIISVCQAIPCDFKYLECDNEFPERSFSRVDFTTVAAPTRVNYEAFECDENDEYVEEKFANASKTSEFLFNNDDDDYSDLEETCQVSRRTIQPKALNNIYNKLTKVVNNGSFIQSITIEECIDKKEQCNIGSEPPVGKKHICRQKHVRITLKALKEGSETNTIVDEQFYYPSHCVCELVSIRKKKPVRSKRLKCHLVDSLRPNQENS